MRTKNVSLGGSRLMSSGRLSKMISIYLRVFCGGVFFLGYSSSWAESFKQKDFGALYGKSFECEMNFYQSSGMMVSSNPVPNSSFRFSATESVNKILFSFREDQLSEILVRASADSKYLIIDKKTRVRDNFDVSNLGILNLQLVRKKTANLRFVSSPTYQQVSLFDGYELECSLVR